MDACKVGYAIVLYDADKNSVFHAEAKTATTAMVMDEYSSNYMEIIGAMLGARRISERVHLLKHVRMIEFLTDSNVVLSNVDRYTSKRGRGIHEI